MKWEDICKRCGLCCHERTVYPDALVIFRCAPCIHFEESTSLCTVYGERFKVCKDCSKMTLFKAMFDDSIPQSCAYAEWARQHHLRFAKEKPMVIEDSIDD